MFGWQLSAARLWSWQREVSSTVRFQREFEVVNEGSNPSDENGGGSNKCQQTRPHLKKHADMISRQLRTECLVGNVMPYRFLHRPMHHYPHTPPSTSKKLRVKITHTRGEEKLLLLSNTTQLLYLQGLSLFPKLPLFSSYDNNIQLRLQNDIMIALQS